MGTINKKKYKIAIVHPKLAFGGSEAAALWLIEALKNNYDVSLITSGQVDITGLNNFYGTNLAPKEFRVMLAPLPFWLRGSLKFAAILGRLIQRYCRRVAPDFDLMISTYTPIIFGKKSMQFIADFSFSEEIRQDLGLITGDWRKWYHRGNFARNAYLTICDWISPSIPKNWKNDIIVANSEWTAQLLQKKYGVVPRVIYPPVVSGFPDIPYQKRENGFVCIGRIAPEKRIDVVVNILHQVRQKGHDVTLHIAGGFDDSQYSKTLQAMCFEHKDWIFLEGKLNQAEKKKMIAQNRFGINGCLGDSFGISVAEMVKGGCIVFVPNEGGQVNIIGHPTLMYDGVKDAVNKIDAVLKDSALQLELRRHLVAQSQKFSTEKFQKEVVDMVDIFFTQKL